MSLVGPSNPFEKKTVVPCAEHVDLTSHDKGITALALEPSGGRLLTGSFDATIQMWDFAGLTRPAAPFRVFSPNEGYAVVALAFEPTKQARQFVVATTASFCQLYDRDGAKVMDFSKGDAYLYDMRRTAGHVAALTGCVFDPRNPDVVWSVSLDGTVRQWDVTRARQGHAMCGVLKSGGNKRVALSCVAMGRGNKKLVATGTAEGKLLLWSVKALNRPKIEIAAHRAGADAVTSVAFSPDGQCVLTRSAGDASMAMFDLRAPAKALWRTGSMPANQSVADCGFAPTDALVYGAVGVNNAGGRGGGVIVLNRETGAFDSLVPVDDGVGVMSSLWSPSINQIIMGRSDGTVRVAFDETLSTKGALLSKGKGPKKQQGVVRLRPVDPTTKERKKKKVEGDLC